MIGMQLNFTAIPTSLFIYKKFFAFIKMITTTITTTTTLPPNHIILLFIWSCMFDMSLLIVQYP